MLMYVQMVVVRYGLVCRGLFGKKSWMKDE